ncbi:putative selenate reductase subunit YgfK [Anaerotruncus rubiinfantis]|uniref:putative selenate reductase subunit YgfK n=1 Tax=Anaerotruncus rubiinfantis TaxID=1720200 RepID=UPI00082B97C0|nr:putative selenate reductase subunit YgfK [Anaerotruncus rubiinfantis]
MSDKMRPIAFDKLMNWALNEYAQQKSIFGVAKVFRHKPDDKKLPIFKERLEAPFGPAAGPHTQLAQNIIAAYAAGSRFFELKTVQKMDGEELSACVAKPCITAADECYNCEWSTELTVPQAFDEYVKAWFACKLLAKELDLGDPDGFVFNMSVGYDLEGIKTPKIDAYIEGMKDAGNTEVFQACKKWALANVCRFAKVDAAYIEAVSPRVSDSITLSTLHGCPPQEIERIATYLITEKNLNTYIKCNPTLLGYEFARKTLDDLGFDYIVFDDHHFKEDLQFSDAVPMFHRLTALTQARGLEFGVKLTNTFPVEVSAGELPSEEMYMSGRSLYPLTISLAKKIAKEFDGKLRISYSGGADLHNIEKLFACGIWPITLATTLLKPGGYERIYQMAEALLNCGDQPFSGVNVAAVSDFAEDALGDPYYRKPIKPLPSRKMARKVPLVDCFEAPCRDGCPISQDIPAYLRLAGEGNYLEALRVITERNPLPFITGTICPHHCADKCTRNFYEESVRIRDVKLEAAKAAYADLMKELKKPVPASDAKVAVVGGGPAGLAAGYFLAKAGVAATVFEKRGQLGGIVRHVIPAFRVSTAAIENDIALVKALGVRFETGVEISSAKELFDQGFTHVIFANGAWKPGVLKLEYGEAMNVIAFLEQCKSDIDNVNLGENVVVIGGGNTAMDAARAAKRAPGVKNVRLVYRRNKRYMPADEEELALAIADGVQFCDLLAPVGVKDGVLTCHRMKLGEPDESGRRRPVDTGEVITVPADTVIAAVGEKVDSAFYGQNGIALTERGYARVNENLETSVPGVYIVGDANRGPATVVEAIADAAKAAKAICGADCDAYAACNVSPDYTHALAKKGKLCGECASCKESDRCLECATVCECCADVCPNRANITVAVPGKRMRQIIHVDGMCNECGNCATFCPYDSAPYKDKFTLFWSEEDFADSENEGFLLLDGEKQTYRVRLDGQVECVSLGDPECTVPEDICRLISAAWGQRQYLF